MSDPADPPRRRGRPGNDRATVLRRAVEVFNRQGYDAASMSDVARELGVSKSAVFHHFASKESLLAAALEDSLARLGDAVDAATSGSGAAGDRLRALLGDSVRVLVAHQPAVTLLLRVRGNSPLEQDALRRRREIDADVAALVREAVAEGSVRGDLDADLVSRLLFGTVNSLVEWHRPGGDTSADQLADTVVALLLEGLVPRGGG